MCPNRCAVCHGMVFWLSASFPALVLCAGREHFYGLALNTSLQPSRQSKHLALHSTSDSEADCAPSQCSSGLLSLKTNGLMMRSDTRGPFSLAAFLHCEEIFALLHVAPSRYAYYRSSFQLPWHHFLLALAVIVSCKVALGIGGSSGLSFAQTTTAFMAHTVLLLMMVCFNSYYKIL